MLVVERPADMVQFIGKKLGISNWIVVDQKMIEDFADVTGDHQWIHVDIERAKREMPGGKTIAHGYLLLSLLARLGPTIYRIDKRSRGIHYGLNKVRFITPVQAGGRIRLHQVVRDVQVLSDGARIILESTLEVEGQERPAVVAETISLSMN